MLKTWLHLKMNTLLTEKVSISKKFYTFIKHKKTDSTGIKTLKKNDVTVTDPENKADLVNYHFHSVFSQQIPMKLSALCAYFSSLFQNNENDMPEIMWQRMVSKKK